jgi:radical SAM protein with 4Fe4S-binding SPASM domain
VDCPHIPELGYGEFSRRLHKKLAGQRLPFSGSVELTFRCNLRCAHCYVADGNNPGAIQHELTTGEWRGIFDQIAGEGCLWLLLTGGEPLTRPDFLDLYMHAKRKGFLLTLFTNGTLFTPRLADSLAEWPPFAVEITLYGRTQATYERVTGVPGSHARCMRGIELLMERGLPLKLKTVLMTHNKHELEDIRTYAESLGVDFRFDPILNAGLSDDAAPTRLRLSPQEVVELDQADARRMESWREFCGRSIGLPARSEYLYTCGAGNSTFHIDPYGQLSSCLMVRQSHYDLRQGNFSQGWHEFIGSVREQKRSIDSRCAQCALLSLCGQCPGWAQLEHGDQEKPVEYLCQVAHLRAEALGLIEHSVVNNSRQLQITDIIFPNIAGGRNDK